MTNQSLSPDSYKMPKLKDTDTQAQQNILLSHWQIKNIE